MFDVCINVFEQVLFIFFLYSLNTSHKNNAVVLSIITFVVNFFLISYINQFSISQSLLTIIFDVIFFIYLCLSTYISNGKSLMFCVIPLSVTAIINSITDMSVMLWLFPGKTLYEILKLYQIPFDLLIQVSHIIAFYYIAKFFRRNEFNMPKKDWYIAASLVGLCNIMAICFETVYLEYETWQYYLLLGVYCVALFIIMILVLFKSMYSHIVQENKQKLEVEILQSQLQSNEKMLQLRQEINSMHHDMKHFITLLKKENTDYDSEQIKSALEEYDSVYRTPVPVQTIIPAVNYVVNIKQDEAIQKGLNFICTLNITQTIAAEESDLYLLLSNLIDNAIQHIGLNKTIRVIIREINDTTMIQVRNSVNGTVIDTNGRFISNYTNDKHGYGLETVQSIANKYHGYFICEQDGDEVVCSVFLPQPNKNL